MRYVRRELVITDVCDEEIKDIATIKDIFATLMKEQSDASVVYYDKPGETAMAYERVRVLNVTDSGVDIQILRSGSVMKAKGIPFEHFVEIKVLATSLDKVLKRKSGERLKFLDIE